MKKLLIFLLALFLFPELSYASAMGGYDPGAVNQQYMRDLRVHEFASKNRNKSVIIDSANKNANQNSNNTSDIPVNVFLKSINFVNNSSVSTQTLNNLVSYALNKPASPADVSRMRKLITKYYQSNGYFSVIVVPDMSALTSGVLTFDINEGSRNSITVE